MGSIDPEVVDVHSADAWADGSAMAWLESVRAPFVRLADGTVAVLGHSEALTVLTDSRRFTSKFGTAPQRRVDVGVSLNLADPPVSTRIRRALELPAIDSQQLITLADQLISTARDLVTEFAQPLALAVFGQVFGLNDAAELNELGVLTRALPRARDAAEFQQADRALKHWLRVRAAEARSGLFFEAGADLAEIDQLYLQRLLAQTGHESTAMAIALSVEVLLRENLPIIATPSAVEELLRVTSPLIRFARESTEDGTRYVVFFPLVNRDPAVFVNPARVELERSPNPHLAFGAGPHQCFGAALARTVIQAALTVMSQRARPRLISAVRLRSSVTNGLERLVVG